MQKILAALKPLSSDIKGKILLYQIAIGFFTILTLFITSLLIRDSLYLLLIPLLITSLVTALRINTLADYKDMQSILKGVPFSTLSLNTLKVYTKKEELFLGEGFIWGKSEVKKCLDIIEKYPGAYKVDAHPKVKGLRFMQALKESNMLYVPVKFLDGHTLITGTTGAGKTRLFDMLIAQAIIRNEAVIILDPKGDKDLCEHAKKVTNMFDERKFKYFHPGYPENSIIINPLHNFNRATELASRIASLIPVARGTNDPFKSFAQLALNAVIGGLLVCHEKPTLKKIRYYIDSRLIELGFLAFKAYFEEYLPKEDKDEWEALASTVTKYPITLLSNYYKFYLKRLRPQKPSDELDRLYTLAKHDATHYGKMIGSLISVLDALTYGELGELLSPANEVDYDTIEGDFSKLIEKGAIIYIGLDSLTDNLVGGALGSLFLADLTSVAGARYNYASKISPVNLFIDECAEVVSDELIQLLNKGRGAGFRLTVATQTVADFEARLGSEAKANQVLGNLNNVISLRIIDNSTKEYIANLLPKIRVNYHARSAVQNSTSDSLLKFSATTSDSITEEEISLFPPQLLSELPDLEFIAKIGGSTLYKGKLPLVVS